MATTKGFEIIVSSKFEGWWRYNVALMCGCFDAGDNRTDFVAAESHVAEVGTNLRERPAEVAADRIVILETPPCDHIVLYIYLIPHTLPAANGIEGTRPFQIDLQVNHDGKKILNEKRPINQWSGASIELRIAANNE